MLNTTTFEQFLQLSKNNNYAVVTLEMMGDRFTPVNVFQALATQASQAILLDTSDYRKHSQADAGVFIGLDPIASFTAFGEDIHITTQTDSQHFTAEPFSALRKFYQHYQTTALPSLAKLAGGIIGVISYDAVRLIEDIGDQHQNIDHFPDLQFTCYGTHIIFDRRTGKILLAKMVMLTQDTRQTYDKALADLALLQQHIEQSNVQQSTSLATKVSPSVLVDSDDTAFMAMIEQAKTYIRKGDAFQIVPSRRFQTHFQGNDFNIYRALKALNPSPYLFYIRYPNYSVIGASPEKLVSLQQGIVEISPIAGSRPRGATPVEDEQLVAELLEDGKELAEHMMLVDLARNDVGRVCKPGSVKVVDSKTINKFSHIMHLTSTIQGELCADYDVFDVLIAGFPAGTLTGAPKIRAMQIIDEIEKTRRGLYGGAVCSIDNQGQMDSCILIRTAVVKDGIATVRTGVGVVLDSNLQAEANESRQKAQGVLAALQFAQEIE